MTISSMGEKNNGEFNGKRTNGEKKTNACVNAR